MSSEDGKSETLRGSKGGSILAPSKFGSSSFGSIGGSGSSVGSSFPGLKASKFTFGSSLTTSSASSGSQKPADDSNTKTAKDSPAEEKPPTDSKSSSSSSSESVNFLPLSKETPPECSSSVSSNPLKPEEPPKTPNIGFTFGENVKSRVESSFSKTSTFGESLSDKQSDETKESSISSSSTSISSSTDTKDESATKETTKENTSSNNYFQTPTNSSFEVKNGSKSLSEAAADYQESHAVKRKYEEVTVRTGEEDESNVVQLPAKLHSFDNAKRNWSEKGRGILRLNDDLSEETSRLVMRSVGVLKVILNTKLFEGMSWERPSEKSIRFSGADDEGGVKIFLLTGSAKDMERLFELTKTRISALKSKKVKQSP